MRKEKTDFEKDYLVIKRDMRGKFRSFSWYSAKETKHGTMEAVIAKWNEDQKKNGEEGRPAELITDPLVREICAYREHAKPLEELMDDAKESREDIDTAVEYLELALDRLKRIRGLGDEYDRL